MTRPRVTAVVTVGRGAGPDHVPDGGPDPERLREGLQDLLWQSLGNRLEVFVIDAGAGVEERRAVLELQRQHPAIEYYRGEPGETPATSLDRIARLAGGTYLTCIHPADRYRPDALEVMASWLDRHRDCGVLYPDSLVADVEVERFDPRLARLRRTLPDYSLTTALTAPVFGSHAIWRRDTHTATGDLDTDLRPVSDRPLDPVTRYDLLLRIASRSSAAHLREPLVLVPGDSGDTSPATDAGTRDAVTRMLRPHRSRPLHEIFPPLAADPANRQARAAALIELGNACALSPFPDLQLALKYYREAAEQDGTESARAVFFNNTAAVLLCMGMAKEAASALRAAGDLPQAAHNRARLADARFSRIPPIPAQLELCALEHPVVQHSRRARCATLVPSPGTDEAEQVPYILQRLHAVPLDRTGDAGEPTAGADRPSCVEGPQPEHVLLVMYGWADSGGGTILPRQVARGLARRGHRVTVFYAGARPRTDLPAYGVLHHREAGVDLCGVFNRPSLFMDLGDPGREADDPRIRSRFEDLLAEASPDVVHFYNLHNLGMSLPSVCRARGIPTVFSSNNYWAVCPRLYLFEEDLTPCRTAGAGISGAPCVECIGDLGSAEAHAHRAGTALHMLNEDLDRHLAVSERVREIHVDNGARPDNITVLHQQPEGLDRIWQRTGRRRALGGRAGPLRVGFIGSLLPHKGAHVLVSALQALPEGSAVGIFHGEVRDDYAAVLRGLDRRGIVELRGAYSIGELADRLAEVDLVVVPSLWEDCAPFVVAEALAARCPVIGSRAGGIPDFIDEGRTGLLFEPGNAADLATALERFVTDPHLLARMQSAIEAPRGFEAYLDELLGVYRELGPCSTLDEVRVAPSMRTDELERAHGDRLTAPR